MDLKVNHNVFIKLKEFFKLQDISAEVDQFTLNEELLEGTLEVKGKYVKRDNVTEEYFSEKVPFSITFNNKDIDVLDILCSDLEYVTVDGRGVDVSFDILVKYEEVIEVPIRLEDDELVQEVSKIEVEPLSTVDYERIKEAETTRIDGLLKSVLEVKDDNHPTDEIVIRGIPDGKSHISVCYYESENDLVKVCNNKGIAIDTVFKENQKYDINKYHRVIIND